MHQQKLKLLDVERDAIQVQKTTCIKIINVWQNISCRPPNRMPRMIAIWNTACPIMFLHMIGDIIAWLRPYGLRFSRSSVGCSVASASDASVSIIRFTHSIWIALNGESCRKMIDYIGTVHNGHHIGEGPKTSSRTFLLYHNIWLLVTLALHSTGILTNKVWYIALIY